MIRKLLAIDVSILDRGNSDFNHNHGGLFSAADKFAIAFLSFFLGCAPGLLVMVPFIFILPTLYGIFVPITGLLVALYCVSYTYANYRNRPKIQRKAIYAYIATGRSGAEVKRFAEHVKSLDEGGLSSEIHKLTRQIEGLLNSQNEISHWVTNESGRTRDLLDSNKLYIENLRLESEANLQTAKEINV